MILIADSGSTKTDWVLIDKDRIQHRFNTIGYNPYFIDAENIYISLSESLLNQRDFKSVETIWFYGAGCSSPEKKDVVEIALKKSFPGANYISVDHDLLASAKALLGNTPGFAAILGTGTNSCIYDGINISNNIDSLGYLLGDEGSGCYIGKKMLRDYMRSIMPPELLLDFDTSFLVDKAHILDTLYHGSHPNRLLASFAAFAVKHKNNEYIKSKVLDAFNDFFKNIVCHYPGYQSYSLNCVGSIGYIFQNELSQVAEKWGMKTGKIIQSPIDSLVEYHMENL